MAPRVQRLMLWAQVLLLVGASDLVVREQPFAQQVAVEAALPLSTTAPRFLQSTQDNSTTIGCLSDDACGATEYCAHPALSNLAGSCAKCWRCCLLPGVYGACPQKCNCREGVECMSHDECGDGMFCAVLDPLDLPRCMRCTSCTSNELALGGDCSLACPSGDLSALALLPHTSVQEYVCMSFYAAGISQQILPVVPLLLEDELRSWLASEGMPPAQANFTVQRLMTDPAFNSGSMGSGAISTEEWVAGLASRTAVALMCPEVDTSPGAQQALAVYAGCYCNATENAASFRCAAGHRCSRSAYLGLSTEALRAPTGVLLRAVCVACEPGQYCPEGTYLPDESTLAVLDCPAGYNCPTPEERYACTAGTFCVARATAAISCDYEKLLKTSPYEQLPLEPESVVERLRDKRDPLRGNFCPERATRPMELCSAGYYCPNVSTLIICPKGYFCKAQSTQPWPCSMLVNCPEGTADPGFSSLVWVILAIIVVSVPLIIVVLSKLDKSVITTQDDPQGVSKIVVTKMTNHLLNSFQLKPMQHYDNKYRGFGKFNLPIKMEFESLGMRLQPFRGEEKVVLQGVSGSFAPHRINAILGPSGCGKTTFLNVLCGKVSNGIITGRVRINGDEVPITRIQKVMGFVPQDDIVHEDLTVRENLAYSARLRLPADYSRERRQDVVFDALEMLGLKAIQHYRVGTVERRGISGGQRKRVNIGLELVAMPSLLFLDEPTSGLDATSSWEILHSLSDMANLGMNLVTVIHQPRFSSFLLFDQVLLLGVGGRTVYMGSPAAAILYFQNYLHYSFPEHENPSDILMDIIAGKVHNKQRDKQSKGTQLVDRWTTGGQAWVEMVEQLNPSMRTKMCDIPPNFLTVIDEEFEIIDRENTGRLNALQLVDLFANIGSPISLEDMVLLVRRLNSTRPVTPYTPGETPHPETLFLTKQQLIETLERLREGQGTWAGIAGQGATTTKDPTANFYASQFVLPDLPEVEQYRADMEQRRRSSTHEPGDDGSPGYYVGAGGVMRRRSTASSGDAVATITEADRTNSEGIRTWGPTTLLLPPSYNAVDGYSAAALGDASSRGEPVRRFSSAGTVAASSQGSPSAVRQADSSWTPSLGPDQVAGPSLKSMLLPGLASQGSSMASARVASQAAGAGFHSGLRPAGQPAPDDLTAFANHQHHTELQQAAADAAAAGDVELQSFESQAGAAAQDASGGVVSPQRQAGSGLVVGAGLVARSLEAMGAIASADVTLPALPRRAERVPQGAPGRADRRNTTYSALSAYVGSYNDAASGSQADDRLQAAADGGAVPAGAPARGISFAAYGRISPRAPGGSPRTPAEVNRRASMAAAAAAAGAGGAGQGEGDLWRAGQPTLTISRSPVLGRPPSLGRRVLPLAPPMAAEASSSVVPTMERSIDFSAATAAAAGAATAAYDAHTSSGFSSQGSPALGSPPRGPGPVGEGLEDEADEGQRMLAAPSSSAATAGASGRSKLLQPAELGSDGPSSPTTSGSDGATGTSDALALPQRIPSDGDYTLLMEPPRALEEQQQEEGDQQATPDSLGSGQAPPYATPPPPAWLQRRIASQQARVAASDNTAGTTPASLRPSRFATASGATAAADPAISDEIRPLPVLQVDLAAAAASSSPERSDGLPSPDVSTPVLLRNSSGGSNGGGMAVQPARSAGNVVTSPERAKTSPTHRLARSTLEASLAVGSPTRSAAAGGPAAQPDDPSPTVESFQQAQAAYAQAAYAQAQAQAVAQQAQGSPQQAQGSPQAAQAQAQASGKPRVARGGARGPRRYSFMQAGSLLGSSFSSQQERSPGSSMTAGSARAGKPRKDTHYINSLLSNALIGAWATTQSVTAGHPGGMPLHGRAGSVGASPHGFDAASYKALRGHSATSPGPSPHTLMVRGASSGLDSPAQLRNAANSKQSSGGGATPGGPMTSGPSALLPQSRYHSGTALGMVSKMPSSVYNGWHTNLMGVGDNKAISAKLMMTDTLPSRKYPSALAQLGHLLKRSAIKYVRSLWPMRVLDVVLQVAAAFIIGFVQGTGWGLSAVPSNAVMFFVCLGVLSCVTHLRTFSQNRVLLWRESASGLSVSAFFLSQNMMDLIWVVAAPAMSLGIYYYLTLPRQNFEDMFVVGICVCWWASGIAYWVSAVLPPQNVLMAGVFISLIFGAFLHGLSPSIAETRGTFTEVILALSYNRWAMEIVSINELAHYQTDMRNIIIMMSKSIGLCGVDQLLYDDGDDTLSPQEAISFLRVQSSFSMDHCDKYKNTAFGALLALGGGFRILAYVWLKWSCSKRH